MIGIVGKESTIYNRLKSTFFDLKTESWLLIVGSLRRMFHLLQKLPVFYKVKLDEVFVKAHILRSKHPLLTIEN